MSEFSLIPLGQLAEIRMGQSPDSTYVHEGREQGVPFLQGNAEFGAKYPAAKYSCLQPAKIAEQGSTLISVRAPVGETNIADRSYCIGRGLAAVKFHHYGESLGRDLLSFHAKELDKVSQGTTFAAIGGGDLRALLVADIPDREARGVERVLDTLDTQIQKTEALIAKLEKVKEGLLHDLLTRGIDENGQLRPSPEQAPELYKDSPLGLIPREWDIVTLKSVSNTVTSGSRDWGRFYASSGALFLRIGNLTREHINFRYDSTIYVRPPPNADGQRTKLEPGDILISITADLGIIGVVPEGIGEAYINQHIALVRPSLATINPRFVGHHLAGQAVQRYISQLNDAGAKAGLNLPTIRNLVTVEPQRVEQDSIAAQLDEIDNHIQTAIREFDKLRELKSGLMDDLLTGHVRVTPLLEQVQARTINPA